MDLNTGEIVTNTEILTNNCILKNKHSLTLKAKSNPNIHIELLFGFRNQADQTLHTDAKATFIFMYIRYTEKNDKLDLNL